MAPIVIGLGCAPVARASFVGTNGSIAYVVERSAPGVRLIESAYLGPEGSLAPDTAKLMSTGVDRAGDAFDPSVSANGRTLAFVSTRSGRRQIYSSALKPITSTSGSAVGCGLEVCALTAGPGESYEPAWARDGRSIVFVNTSTGAPQLYRMTATGAGVTRLTFDGGVDQQPAWSQAGKVAFVSNVTGTPQIYVMNGQGGELRQLTQGAGSMNPSWSPDGSELAYVSGTAAGNQVFVVALAGGEPRQLTSSQPESRLAVWSPDATKLLVTRGPDPTGRLRMEVIDVKSRLVVSRRPYLGTGEGRSWAPLPPAPPNNPAPIQAGVTAIARPLSGKVEVNPTHPLAAAMSGEMTNIAGELPGQSTPASMLTRSAEVPVNSTYNATRGVVKLIVSRGVARATSTAILSGGRFRLLQRASSSVPTIRLLGRPRGCRHGRASIASRASRLARLRGHTKHGYRLVAGDSAAGTMGTRWEIRETCRGTLYRAIEHSLWVTDPQRRRPVRVRAGHQYLVRSGG